MQYKAPSRPPPLGEAIHTQNQIIEMTLHVWICTPANVVEQKAWNCTKVPLPPFRGGRRRERPFRSVTVVADVDAV